MVKPDHSPHRIPRFDIMKNVPRLLLSLLVILLLAACSAPEAPVATPVPTDTPQPTATFTPEPSPTLPHTLTPISIIAPTSTATPVPSSVPTDTPTPTPAPLPTDTPVPSYPLGQILRNTSVRNGPGQMFPIVGDIAGGQKVGIMAIDPAAAWLRLDLGGPDQSWVLLADVNLLKTKLAEIPVETDVPTPPPAPTPSDVVQLYGSAVSLPTYPWQNYLTPTVDPVSGWEYDHFDAGAYAAERPLPAPREYKLVNLENRWVRVNVMPELGGRLYQLIFKPTGSNAFYQNRVVKPSPWGPGEHGNGWLAVGGIEWGLPVPEHGYATSEPWGYITLPGNSDQGITVFDNHQNTVHLSVSLTLQPDTAAVILDFDLTNEGGRAIPTSFWVNAMVAPGPANTVGPDLRFLYTGNKAIMHSTGDDDLPKPDEVFSWPIYRGRDLSRLGNWNHWMGFFMYPRAQADWAAIYDPSVDEGIVRIFPPDMMPGLKGFGFGWQNPISPDNYTDDGSAYIEMQGGITPTFSESLTLRPGDLYQWREVWYPVAGIGGVTRADRTGAVHLSNENDGMHLRLFVVQPMAGDIAIVDASGLIITDKIQLTPDAPGDILLPQNIQLPLSFSLETSDGRSWQMNGLW